MQVFTIGYGGRTRESFLSLIEPHGIRAVVDVRIRPERASMGIWVKAKTPDKGIQKLLGDAGIEYYSLLELGNMFRDFDDWQPRYQQLLEQSGELLIERLADIPRPYCLMCAEKRVAECHRRDIAEYLARRHRAVLQHLE